MLAIIIVSVRFPFPRFFSLESRPNNATFVYPFSCFTSSEMFNLSVSSFTELSLFILLARMTDPITTTPRRVPPNTAPIFLPIDQVASFSATPSSSDLFPCISCHTSYPFRIYPKLTQTFLHITLFFSKFQYFQSCFPVYVQYLGFIVHFNTIFFGSF